MNDKILITSYSPSDVNTWAILFKYQNYDSFVFTCEDISSEQLNSICDELNLKHPNAEWLWSHPEQGGNSTPIPVLILQDKAKLEGLRQKVGYYDE